MNKNKISTYIELEKFIEDDLNKRYQSYGMSGRIVYEIKKQVDSIANFKIHIYSNDHNPPHIHFINDALGVNLSINVKSSYIIEGTFRDWKVKKKLQYYIVHNRERLMSLWNEMRPNQYQCPNKLFKEEKEDNK